MTAKSTTTKPTVLHVITGLGLGGAERVLVRLVTAAKGFRHVVVSLTGDGELMAPLRVAGIPVIPLHLRHSRLPLLGLVRLVGIMRRERPAVIQTWLYHADLFGLLAAKLARVRPVIWNIRCSDMDFSLYRPSARIVVRLLSLISPLPDAVIVNSVAGREVHTALGYRPRRWELLPNGIDTAVFRPDTEARTRWRHHLGIDENTVLIGMVARRDPMKDHESMLAAAAIAASRRQRLAFVLAGRDVLPADPALARLAGAVPAPVHLIGPCDEVPGLMASLDIAVLSSAFGEGFPNVVAEAMAAGAPCIVTDVGDAAAIVAETGRVVSPRQPVALADALIALAANGAERRRLGAAARQRIEERYGLADAVGRYEALWRDMVAASPVEAATDAAPQPAVSRRRYSQDVSVVIPVYNRSREIGRAVASALGQTLPPHEIIIVDDGSIDDTAAVVRAIADPRVRLICHDRNYGAATARNTGASAAASNWIAFLDSDDEWAPDKLKRQLHCIETSPTNAVACVTGYTLDDRRYRTVDIFRPGAAQVTFGSLIWGCSVSLGSTLLVLRDAFREVGPFDTHLTRFEDWDWLLRFCKTHVLAPEPDILTIVHKSDNPPLWRVEPSLAVIREKHRQSIYASSWIVGRRFDSTLAVEMAAAAYYERRYARMLANLLRAMEAYPFRNAAFFCMLAKRLWRLLRGPSAESGPAVDDPALPNNEIGPGRRNRASFTR